MPKKRYFGTDGIRGYVGKHPITADFLLKLGWAAGKALASDIGNRVLIGKDTRISGYMIESALEAGLSAAGVHIILSGPMPTPAIAYLTRTLNASAGIVISASHNPYYDNGIKFFSAQGTKLPDSVEHHIEKLLDSPLKTVGAETLGKAQRIDDAAGRYIEFCKSTVSRTTRLNGLNIVVDCAHGATYHIAPNVFTELGAQVTAIGAKPDGLNINDHYGSTSPANLQQKVLEEQADLGIAFDGDGDRVIMVDHTGALVDGDELLYIIAQSYRRRGRPETAIAGTLMSNLGLENALKSLNIQLHRTKVGDRYVMECLKKEGLVLGGESSGHIICLDKTSTGDGIVAALQVLEAMVDSDCTLKQLHSGVKKYPQQMINVPLSPGFDLQNCKPIWDAVTDAEHQLAHRGRVLLRPSGTEPVVRVMVEAEEHTLTKQWVTQLADTVTQAVNATGE